MKCVLCKHGETQAGITTVTVDQDGMTLVLKHVPAEICGNCGADFTTLETQAQLELLVARAKMHGTILEVIEYPAA